MKNRLRSFLIKSKYQRFFVQQHDSLDCAAACVAMICRYYGANVSLAKVRQHLKVGHEGSSMQEISLAANALFLTTRAEIFTSNHLEEAGEPFIYCKDYHFYVCFGFFNGFALIADPSSGISFLPAGQFESRPWHCFVLFKKERIPKALRKQVVAHKVDSRLTSKS